MWWFLAAFGVAGVTLMILGWKKSSKPKQSEPDVWLTGEWAKMYYGCIEYMERLYQPK